MKQYPGTRFISVIPARYASQRFPGKPLALIGGITMIERVYSQTSKAIGDVWVATDDLRIRDAVSAFGGRVIMTSREHRSGTDRIAEAVKEILGMDPGRETVVVNVQGDEPFIKPEQIESLMECFSGAEVEIATLVRKVLPGEDLFTPHQPKVLLARNMDALCFSRSVIPYFRDANPEEWSRRHDYYKHIGLYGYRASTLMEITSLEQSPAEKAESLEQMRWLENGYRVRCAITEWESMGIDTPEDLIAAEKYLIRK